MAAGSCMDCALNLALHAEHMLENVFNDGLRNHRKHFKILQFRRNPALAEDTVGIPDLMDLDVILQMGRLPAKADGIGKAASEISEVVGKAQREFLNQRVVSNHGQRVDDVQAEDRTEVSRKTAQ